MHEASRKLREEHRSIAAVLHGLLALVRTLADPRVLPEFPVLHAMIRYIDAFPERLHHPKEDNFLFARLAARAPESIPLVERLRAEHAFRGNEDPIADLREKDFDELYRKIVSLAPDPVGLGERWKKTG